MTQHDQEHASLIWIIRVAGFGIQAHVLDSAGRPLCRFALRPTYWRQLSPDESPPTTGRCFRCVARLAAARGEEADREVR